ncbi:vWA domain-containing protein [Planctobacterium marinum]|uniref:vWA domain-containing protein n=1 Tax=Planctobacterium marinum TaxID=1631968 RepID=UPI001E5FB16F|nr:VWA domain-containing protein [Planctobacterium marinum]MCC2604526.1 VWA domain-containing protein [Planctobacterium marinum]
MIEFLWIWAFALLPLPLLARLLPGKKAQQQAALMVPQLTQGMQSIEKPASRSKVYIILASLAWIALVTAAARPQWLGDPISIPSEGRDLMLAVDLSGSMEMEDMAINGRTVNRLQMIKYVMDDFIERRVGDRIGLILFGDTAYLQAPLTYDRETVKTLLSESLIKLVGERTAIGDAVGLAVKRFRKKEESNRVLILLTDGQNTAGNLDPMQAKELAVAEDITIYTIGVGADQMITRGLFGNRRINPSAELDEGMLTDLAQATGGQYFRARDVQELEQIYSTLDELEPIARETRQMRPLKALFYYPLALALIISALMALIPLVKRIFVFIGGLSRGVATR